MNLGGIGRLVAQRRRAKAITLQELATAAGVGRSTLAALEAGKLAELGFAKVGRICKAVDLILDVRPLELDTPLIQHRHLTEAAGRELTKAAIEDVITRADISGWRGLVRAMRADSTGRIARRAREVVDALSKEDSKARAFATLLPDLLRQRKPPGSARRG